MGDCVIDQIPTDHDVDRHRRWWVTDPPGVGPGQLHPDLRDVGGGRSRRRGSIPASTPGSTATRSASFAQVQRRQRHCRPRRGGSRRATTARTAWAGQRLRPGATGRYRLRRRLPLRHGFPSRGGAWIGILLVLFALRFFLVDSFAGTHAAVFWVLGYRRDPAGGPGVPLLLAAPEASRPALGRRDPRTAQFGRRAVRSGGYSRSTRSSRVTRAATNPAKRAAHQIPRRGQRSQGGRRGGPDRLGPAGHTRRIRRERVEEALDRLCGDLEVELHAPGHVADAEGLVGVGGAADQRAGLPAAPRNSPRASAAR